MHTDDSLKAIALANSDQASDRCLAKRNQWAAMLSPNYFLIFDILIKNSRNMAYIKNTPRIFEQKLLK